MPEQASRRLLPTLLAVLALVAASCGGGDDSSSSDAADDTDTSEPEPEPEPEFDDSSEPADDTEPKDSSDPDEERTASAKGIEPDTIKVGVSMLDFAFLVENNFSPAGWGDQQGVWEALIADLNARGGHPRPHRGSRLRLLQPDRHE